VQQVVELMTSRRSIGRLALVEGHDYCVGSDDSDGDLRPLRNKSTWARLCSYDLEAEEDADREVVRLLTAAGYDPRAILSMLRCLDHLPSPTELDLQKHIRALERQGESVSRRARADGLSLIGLMSHSPARRAKAASSRASRPTRLIVSCARSSSSPTVPAAGSTPPAMPTLRPSTPISAGPTSLPRNAPASGPRPTASMK